MRSMTQTMLTLSLLATLSFQNTAQAGGFTDLIRSKTRHSVSDGVAIAIGQSAAQATHQGIKAGLKKVFKTTPKPPAKPVTHPRVQPDDRR